MWTFAPQLLSCTYCAWGKANSSAVHPYTYTWENLNTSKFNGGSKAALDLQLRLTPLISGSSLKTYTWPHCEELSPYTVFVNIIYIRFLFSNSKDHNDLRGTPVQSLKIKWTEATTVTLHRRLPPRKYPLLLSTIFVTCPKFHFKAVGPFDNNVHYFTRWKLLHW